MQKLGKRHVKRGVQIPHYEVVGQALIATLSDGLGAEFTDDLKASWVQLYGVIVDTMTKGNYDPKPQKSYQLNDGYLIPSIGLGTFAN